MIKREFKTIKKGDTYKLPKWKHVHNDVFECLDVCSESEGVFPDSCYLTIQFPGFDYEENNKTVPGTIGVFHDAILSMLIEDIKYRNKIMPIIGRILTATRATRILVRIGRVVRKKRCWLRRYNKVGAIRIRIRTKV